MFTSCAQMLCLGLLLSMTLLVNAEKKGPCFNFHGRSFLEFKPNNFNNSGSVHYKLRLWTRAPEGVLMFSEGPDDYEALFLQEGRLIYLLTNPSPSGVEGTSGGHYVSKYPVNNATWLQIDVWRNWEERHKHHRALAPRLRTGFRVRDARTGLQETRLDHIPHRAVSISGTVYFGGVKQSAVHAHGASKEFYGRLSEIHEVKNRVHFHTYTLNFDGRVTRCS